MKDQDQIVKPERKTVFSFRKKQVANSVKMVPSLTVLTLPTYSKTC